MRETTRVQLKLTVCLDEGGALSGLLRLNGVVAPQQRVLVTLRIRDTFKSASLSCDRVPE